MSYDDKRVQVTTGGYPSGGTVQHTGRVVGRIYPDADGGESRYRVQWDDDGSVQDYAESEIVQMLTEKG